jgi:hypothetical protein
MPMAFCHDPTNPANLTPEQRVDEIAAILATGVLRLHRRAALPTASSPSQNPSDSALSGLDDSPETRLHGQKS